MPDHTVSGGTQGPDGVGPLSAANGAGGRRGVPGLPTRHPISSLLPGLYQEDDFARRFTSGLDEVLAPVFCTLDSLDAYVDPELAPMDFVRWLSDWVGMALDETWPEASQRALVRRAAELYRWRGTVRGLAGLVSVYTGLGVEITDSGGAEWSSRPADRPPTRRGHQVKIRLIAPRGTNVDVRRLDRLVTVAKPAHVVHEIELVRS